MTESFLKVARDVNPMSFRMSEMETYASKTSALWLVQLNVLLFLVRLTQSKALLSRALLNDRSVFTSHAGWGGSLLAGENAAER